ncbi:hypothetical protein ACTXT7_002250 [Hymenolepis weldensis]
MGELAESSLSGQPEISAATQIVSTCAAATSIYCASVIADSSSLPWCERAYVRVDSPYVCTHTLTIGYILSSCLNRPVYQNPYEDSNVHQTKRPSSNALATSHSPPPAVSSLRFLKHSYSACPSPTPASQLQQSGPPASLCLSVALTTFHCLAIFFSSITL